ncbi:MAG TPA: ABC transporter permease [Gemmatimonas sp.]|nr:ABC transporter permease [Gemmatimonas sp.]
MVRRPGPTARSRQDRPAERALNTLAGRIAGRLAGSVLVVAAAVTLSFVLIHAAPGDPLSNMGAEPMSPELVARLRQAYRLDEPVLVQYGQWLALALQGDFGYSPLAMRPVSALLADALPATLQLMGMALLSSIGLGVLLGGWQGARADSPGDRSLSLLSLVMYSVPEFCLGIVLLMLFVPALPPGGMTSDTADMLPLMQRIVDRLRHFILPWLSLTIVGTAVFARFQRAAMRDTMREPFVRTARAKGLDERQVRRQALRTSLLPVITIAGLTFPALLGGAVVVEKLFNWPGMGQLLWDAISRRDHWVLAGAVVVGSTMTVLGNLLADVTRAAVDPRVERS